jgi:hypothetical protein
VPRRITNDNASWGDVPRDHRTGAYKCASTDYQAWKHHRPCTQGSTLTNARLSNNVRPYSTSRKGIIGERNIWPDKHIIFDAQAIPKLHAGFDRNPVADDDIALN